MHECCPLRSFHLHWYSPWSWWYTLQENFSSQQIGGRLHIPARNHGFIKDLFPNGCIGHFILYFNGSPRKPNGTSIGCNWIRYHVPMIGHETSNGSGNDKILVRGGGCPLECLASFNGKGQHNTIKCSWNPKDCIHEWTAPMVLTRNDEWDSCGGPYSFSS